MSFEPIRRRLARTAFATAAGIGLAALLSACGGGEGTEQAEASAATSAATPATSTATTQQRAFNAVVTAADGAATLEGRFERAPAYLSQGGTVMRGDGVGAQRASYPLRVPQKGYYELFAWWPQAAEGAGPVDTEVQHASGRHSRTVDQSVLGGQWNSMGVHALDPGQPGVLSLSARAGARLYADAVRVQWVGTERPELRLDPKQLPVADRHDPYEAQIEVWGASGTLSYRLVGGELPEGLELDSRTGRISGAPAQDGSFRLELAITDTDGRTVQGEVELEVVDSADTPASIPDRPFELRGDRQSALQAQPLAGAATSATTPTAQLGNLPAIIRAMPEGSWHRVNLNRFSDAWVPADLRPLFGLGNPTPAKIISAWSGFAWDSNRGNLMLYGGGHANYRGNEVYLWRGATQMWERASLPSEMRQDANGNWNAIDGADAAPASAHTYDNTLFFPVIDRLVVVGGAADSNGGHYFRLNATGGNRITGFYLFDPARAHPDRVGGTTGSHVRRVAPWPEIVGGNMWSNRETRLTAASASVLRGTHVNGCSATTQVNGRDVAYFRNADTVFRLTISNVNDPGSDVWERVGIKWSGSGTKATCTFDPEQQILLRTATQTAPFVYWSMANAGPNNRDVVVVPADPSGTFMPALASNAVRRSECGLEFDPKRRNYKLWCGGGTVWQVNPPPTVSAIGWSVVPLAPVGGGAVPDAAVRNGVLGKWEYIPNLDVFMALQDPVQGNIWVYKPVGWVDPGSPGGPPPNQPPTVSLVQPAQGATFSAGQPITLAAQAQDSDGSVQRVEFYAGVVKLGEATAAPFNFVWNGAPVGTHALRAVAHDNGGAQAASQTVTISVAPAASGPQVVTLQRGTLPGAVVADTYLSEYSKTRNFGSADSMLELRQYNMLYRMAIFQSEGGPVPNGAVIESAVFSVYKWSSFAMTYGLHRVLQPWSETGATWNERLPGSPWASPGGRAVDIDYAGFAEAVGSVGHEPGWVNFDISAAVRQQGSSVVFANQGWRLHPVSGATSSLKRFHSSEFAADASLRPKLVISYR
jgi:hypothetical protein